MKQVDDLEPYIAWQGPYIAWQGPLNCGNCGDVYRLVVVSPNEVFIEMKSQDKMLQSRWEEAELDQEGIWELLSCLGNKIQGGQC